MKYLNYNTEGQIIGIYDKEIHSIIPEPNIEITDEAWEELIKDIENHHIIDDVLIYTPKTQEQIEEEIRLVEIKATLDKAQQEVEDELQNILRSIAIEKYIEKQTGL